MQVDHSETFIEHLPVEAGAAQAPTEKYKPKVLCVDDEPGIIKALKRLLRREGFEVMTADGGQAALELMKEHEFDLLVSDMRMPGMSGSKFFTQAKSMQPDAPRILLTGYSDLAATVSAVNHGEIFRYVAKPWVDDDLVATLRSALELKFLRAEKRKLTRTVERQNEQLHLQNQVLEAQVDNRTKELVDLNQQLRRQYFGTIELFNHALEKSHNGVSGQSYRVKELVKSLCKELGLGTRLTRTVVQAALFHNLGYLVTDSDVLAKPRSGLARHELEQFEKHGELGAKLLMYIRPDKECMRIVREYRANYDGSGHPAKLKKGDIHMGARILRVAADFESWVNGCASGGELPPVVAVQQLERNSGSHYDPKIVRRLRGAISHCNAYAAYRAKSRKTVTDLKVGDVLGANISFRGLFAIGRKGEVLKEAAVDLIKELRAPTDEVIVYAVNETDERSAKA